MNIYISNLDYGVDDNGLRNLFEQHGNVSSAKVITDRYTGKSRGFGFVEMPSDEEANSAIEKLNQSNFEGKTITVNVAKPKTDKPRSDYGGGGGHHRSGGGGYGGERRERRW